MSNNKSYYYVVKKGKNPGIFKTWIECKEQIHEFPGAIYKKFDNILDADKFLHSIEKNNDMVNKQVKNIKNEKNKQTLFDYFDEYEKTNEKTNEKTQDDINEDNECNTRNELNPNNTVNNTIYIFCDGSAIHNKNHKSIRCGYGLFILIPTENDFNCAVFGEELVSSGTNNLAELNAILHGLKYLKNEYYSDDSNITRNVCFVSDSKYSINSILVWSKSWIRNNWQTVNNKPVENKEVIQDILMTLEEVKKLKFIINFKHINSHQIKPENNKNENMDYLFWFGNEMADQLARTGKINKKHETPKILEK
jgi:ribonuclease HI